MQLDLLASIPTRPLARRHDPQTSKDAAARSSAFSSTHAGRIHIALVGLGRATAHELQAVTGLSVVQLDRRLPDLKARGLARPTGEVRDGFRVWEAT